MTKTRREPYAKLFASWWCHPRTGPLSLAAGGLEARMLSWSSHHGADGRVPKTSVAQLAGGGTSKRDVDRALAELLRAGVVIEDGDALVVRDYLDANISRQRDEERRHGQNERQSRHRAASVARNSEGNAESVTRDIPAVTRDQSVSHRPSLDHDHDHDHTLSERVGRAPPTLLGVEAVEASLRRGYAKRFEREAGDAWMTHARDTAHIQRAAAWCRTQPDVNEAIERFLDGAFRHEPWRKWRWKWEYLAEDPGHTASRSPAPVGSMAGHESAEAAAQARVAAIPSWTAEELAKTRAEGGW